VGEDANSEDGDDERVFAVFRRKLIIFLKLGKGGGRKGNPRGT